MTDWLWSSNSHFLNHWTDLVSTHSFEIQLKQQWIHSFADLPPSHGPSLAIGDDISCQDEGTLPSSIFKLLLFLNFNLAVQSLSSPVILPGHQAHSMNAIHSISQFNETTSGTVTDFSSSNWECKLWWSASLRLVLCLPCQVTHESMNVSQWRFHHPKV